MAVPSKRWRMDGIYDREPKLVDDSTTSRRRYCCWVWWCVHTIAG